MRSRLWQIAGGSIYFASEKHTRVIMKTTVVLKALFISGIKIVDSARVRYNLWVD